MLDLLYLSISKDQLAGRALAGGPVALNLGVSLLDEAGGLDDQPVAVIVQPGSVQSARSSSSSLAGYEEVGERPAPTVPEW